MNQKSWPTRLEMRLTKYDDVSWHAGVFYPKDVPPENAAFHLGYFVRWAILRDLISQEHLEESDSEARAVRSDEISGSQFLLKCMDGVITPDDLSQEGREFADAYYAKHYSTDLAASLPPKAKTAYEVQESLEIANRVADLLDVRFREWREGRPSRWSTDDLGGPSGDVEQSIGTNRRGPR